MVLGVAPIHRKKRDRKIIKAAQRREAVQGLVIETGRTEEEEAEEEEEEEQEDLLLATSGVKNGPFPLQILGGLLLRLFLPSPSHIQTTYFNITSNIIIYLHCWLLQQQLLLLLLLLLLHYNYYYYYYYYYYPHCYLFAVTSSSSSSSSSSAAAAVAHAIIIAS